MPDLDAQQIARLFTDRAGNYYAARWRRPIAPVVFGVDDATLSVVKGAVEAAVALAGHRMAETDPEMGANLWVFFFRDWDELLAVPDLENLVGGLSGLVRRAQAAGADQARLFRHEPDGAIRAAFIFLRMAGPLAEAPADALALDQAVRVLATFAEGGLPVGAATVDTGEGAMIAPAMARLLRALYDPLMPDVARDASHALRLAARLLRTDGLATPGATA